LAKKYVGLYEAPSQNAVHYPPGKLHRSLASSATPSASSSAFAPLDLFYKRHTGSGNAQANERMLQAIGVKSIEELMEQTVPKSIRTSRRLRIGPKRAESEVLAELRQIAKQNEIRRNFIGCGYYGTIMPPVIQRNILENPAWYTQYTPYQAEVAQGRLESLLNFQTMVSDLTGLPIANASLLDESTAAAEAMSMCASVSKRKKLRFFVDNDVHPQTIAVMQTRAEPMDIELVVGDWAQIQWQDADFCGVMVQYPATDGRIENYAKLVESAHAHGARVVAATDLLALTMLRPPGDWGADIAIGSAQRFGVPMGYGGPSAAFFSCRDDLKRLIPGRIIGISRDAQGKPALRMALQTREQHIRRDKATSNVCTAQALLANISAMYGLYHGPEGLRAIADRVQRFARTFASAVSDGVVEKNAVFDTVRVDFRSPEAAQAVLQRCDAAGLNVRTLSKQSLAVSFDETHTRDDLQQLVSAFRGPDRPCSVEELERIAASLPPSGFASLEPAHAQAFERKTPYMTHPVFHEYRTEHKMVRYIHQLAAKDLSLVHSMIPLGSCTMKLNATSEMMPVSWPEFALPHPFTPPEQMRGYQRLFNDLERVLADITGFAAVSLQPNSGAQGEYAGLLTFLAYHKARGQHQRKVCIVPTSAHGTNPASAKMAGMHIIPVGTDSNGNIDIAELRARAEQNREHLAAAMITYPSTHGVFEEGIKEICDIIHANGGLVYIDGANLNAQMGLTSPAEIGGDACHLNLHKTLTIPHGGGGPGVGAIAVTEALAPFLPSHPVRPVASAHPETAIGPVAAAPYGSASILPIVWMFVHMMGSDGLREASEQAILNANYMAARLAPAFSILYRGSQGRCAHEFILDLRPFKTSAGVTETDVAKRLQDYGFHSPTMSWPVAGTLMIEPTESESIDELDRFCDAMLMIREEIRQIEQGRWDPQRNPLKYAPHTAEVVMADTWDRPYPREVAAFPASWLYTRGKFWPRTSRIDDVYGDRNLVCSCPPVPEMMNATASGAASRSGPEEERARTAVASS
jgi:glycine dehydrogenase